MRTECERCGECCRAGGPALHLADVELFERGVLGYRHVYTLRAGEVVHEQVRGGLVRLEAEMIKVKSIGMGVVAERTCGFYNPDGSGCDVYADRPVECRALKCWDTADLEMMYLRDRLTRNDLIRPDSALGQVIADHEKACPAWRMWDLVSALDKGEAGAAQEVLSLVRFDESMRQAFMYKAQVGAEYLDLFFGRPLAAAIHQFGLEMEDREGTLLVRPMPRERRPRLLGE